MKDQNLAIMYKSMKIFIGIVLLFSIVSCGKFKDYFKRPNPESLIETIQSATLTGYAVSTAFAVMRGQSFSHVTTTRNTDSYPCFTLMVLDLENEDQI